MRKKLAEKTETGNKVGSGFPSIKGKLDIKSNWRALAVMAFILFLAVAVRTMFSFGTSSSSNYALSGGSAATDNLRVLAGILSNGAIFITDPSLHYPYGSTVTAPLVFDLVMYPFALIYNAILNDPNAACSLSLALSGPVFAALACIPMYYLGREMFGSKLAGYLSALFLALCPIFVEESVFSNGAATSFTVFILLLAIYFAVKAIKAVPTGESGGFKGMLKDNKQGYRYALAAGLMLALTAITWTSYRSIVIPFAVVAIAQVIIDRFRGKDPMRMASIYSVILVVGALISAVYMIAFRMWGLAASGATIIAMFATVYCLGYATFSKKPWILTLPISIVVSIVLFAILFFVSPDMFNATFSGNSVLNPEYLAVLGSQRMTLSQLATFYGYITYWCVFILGLFMIYRFKSNCGSPLYVFTLFWLVVMTFTCCHGKVECAVCSPVFGLGFAGLASWIIGHIDFKGYFAGIKTGAGIKLKLRRVISPIPFVTVLVAVFLVAAPNMMQVIDAGISSNDTSDYNKQTGDLIDREYFGSLGYYIKTDDTWNVKGALTDFKDKSLYTAGSSMVSWLEYSSDISMYGNLSSTTDTNGNGAVPASNILLANATDGSSTAAMLISLLFYCGLGDDVENALIADGMTTSQFNEVRSALVDTESKLDSMKYDVTHKTEVYGNVALDVSDKNVRYIWLKNYITDNFTEYQISDFYDSVCSVSGKSFTYVMVTGDMFPLSYGYSNVFYEMGKLNGYSVNTSYGTVEGFTTYSYYTYYYGIYDFTSAMYNSLLYRTYIGMTPSEAGYSSLYAYVAALTAADSSVKMYPGYGLSNYEVAYWQVMYNADSNANSASSGWEQMDGNAAKELQAMQGGVINYLSGLPIILKYVPNSESSVGGKVVDSANNGVAGVRVSVIDADGVQRGSTHTDANGNYKLFVADKSTSTLVFYASSETVSDGVLFNSYQLATGTQTVPDISAPTSDVTALAGYYDVNGSFQLYSSVDVNFVGKVSKVNETVTSGSQFNDLVCDTYDVTVTKDGVKLFTTTYTVTNTASQTAVLADTVYEYTVKIADEYGANIADGTDVSLKNTSNPDSVATVQAKDGKAVFKVPAGTYSLSVTGSAFSNSVITVSSNSSTDRTMMAAYNVTLSGCVDGALVTVTNGSYSVSAVATGTSLSVSLPKSSVSSAYYTASFLSAGKLYYTAFALTGTMSATFASPDYVKLAGTVNTAAGSAASSGTVTVFLGDAAFRYAIASDGSYTVYVPKDTAALIHATNNTDASLSQKTCAADTTEDITLESAKKVEGQSVLWSSVSFSYIDVKLTNSGFSGFNMHTVTVAGSYGMYIPESLLSTTTVTVVKDTNKFSFVGNLDDGSANEKSQQLSESSYAFSPKLYNRTGGTDPTYLTVENDLGFEVKLTLSTETTIASGATSTFSPTSSSPYFTLGKKTSTSNESTEYYYATSYRFNPMATGNVQLSKLLGFSSSAEALAEVCFQSVYVAVGEGDNVSFSDVDPNGNGSSYTTGYKDGDGKTQYMVKAPSGFTTNYLFTASNGTTVYYQSVTLPDASLESITYTLAESCVVSGYVGVAESGTITAKWGMIELSGDVKDGKYSLTLPQGVDADLECAIKSTSGTYSVITRSVSTSGTSMTVNLSVDEGKTNTFVADVTSISYVGTIATVEMKIAYDSIKSNSDKYTTFALSAGEGWSTLVFSFAGENVNSVIANSGGTVGSTDIIAVGTFNTEMYSLTSYDLRLVAKGDLTYNGFVGDSVAGYVHSNVSFGTIVNKTTDSVGDFDYSYAFAINNLDNFTKQMELNITTPVDASKWIAVLEQKSLNNTLTTIESIASGSISGVRVSPGANLFSIKLEPVGAITQDTQMPELKFTVKVVDDAKVYTTTDSTVSVLDNVATVVATPADAEVTATSMSASGRDVLNNRSDMPAIVWVLIALIVLVTMLIVYMGMRRGVFARRK